MIFAATVHTQGKMPAALKDILAEAVKIITFVKPQPLATRLLPYMKKKGGGELV